MKSYSSALSTLLFFILLLSSCQKDLDQIVPFDSKSYLTNVFGTIVDNDGEAIAGAVVNFKGQTIESDEYGTYLFKNVEVDSRYNHLNVFKDGYFQNTRTFRGNESKMILLKSRMIAILYENTFLSSEPNTVTSGQVTIDFDGKGMVVKNTNETYEGEVEVAIQYLDPLDSRTGDIMPGDLSGVNSSGSLRLLESFGMLGVELRATDGRALQLSDQSKSTITVNIPNELNSDAPDEIPLWHFNHELGLWEEEGSAKKVGDTYTGDVSHFSFWNFDLKRVPVMVSGRLLDPNGVGLASMQVKIVRGNERRGGSGYTDYDGYFSGPIEKGIPLELTVTSKCNGEEVVYSSQIGPFESEADLGDIVLDIPNVEYLSVQGTFLDCDGEILEDGLLKINDQGRPDYFPIIGGSIDKTLGICGLEAVELEVIDRQKLQKKTLGNFDVPGTVEIGEVKVCDDPVNFVTITSPTFDLDLVLVDSVLFSSIQWSKTLLSFDYSYDLAVFEIKYVDQDEQSIEEGTHKILKMVCNFRPDSSSEEIVLVLYEGNIIVEEVNDQDRTVKGSFLFEATIAGSTSDRHVFEGNFFSYF